MKAPALPGSTYMSWVFLSKCQVCNVVLYESANQNNAPPNMQQQLEYRNTHGQLSKAEAALVVSGEFYYKVQTQIGPY